MKSEWLKPYYSSLLSAEPITITREGLTNMEKMLNSLNKSAEGYVKKQSYTPSRILKSGNRTIVFWSDGTKTIVKRADDEAESDYAAFTAAVAKRLYGSNSAVKKIMKSKTEHQKREK